MDLIIMLKKMKQYNGSSKCRKIFIVISTTRYKEARTAAQPTHHGKLTYIHSYQ